MEELLKLLDAGKYEEAQKGFQQMYEHNGNPIALYYVTIIEYWYKQNQDLELIDKNFDILFNYNKEIRMNVAEYYIAFLIENNNYKKCLEITTKSLKELKESYLLCYGYSASLVRNDKGDSKEALTYALKSLEFENVNEMQRLLAYSNLIDIYKIRNEYDKAHETVNKLYLISSNLSFINYIELRLAISEENEEEIEKIAQTTINQRENKYNTLYLLSSYYYENGCYEKAIKYYKELIPLLEDSSFAIENIAISYMCLEKYDEAIKLLNEQDLNSNDGYYSYLLGECYFYKPGKIYYKEAVKYYNDALKITVYNKEKILKSLGECYIQLVDLENLQKVTDELRKINKHGYCDYLQASLYRASQRFDEAEKLLKEIRKSNDIPSYKVKNLEEACLAKPEFLDDYFNLALKKEDTFSIRNRLKISMFGEYKNTIDNEKAKEFAIELEKRKDAHTCCYSTLSNYYLFIDDDKKAYEMADIGYQRYMKNEEECQCCAPFIAYCKLHGRGTEKDIEGAYNICKEVEKKELLDINENLGHVYAECSILLNKDLNYIYDMLIRTTCRRYSTSRYFMLIKVGKLLNKDISKYEVLFKESLKHSSIREKEYYASNPDTFLLNNY